MSPPGPSRPFRIHPPDAHPPVTPTVRTDHDHTRGAAGPGPSGSRRGRRGPPAGRVARPVPRARADPPRRRPEIWIGPTADVLAGVVAHARQQLEGAAADVRRGAVAADQEASDLERAAARATVALRRSVAAAGRLRLAGAAGLTAAAGCGERVPRLRRRRARCAARRPSRRCGTSGCPTDRGPARPPVGRRPPHRRPPPRRSPRSGPSPTSSARSSTATRSAATAPSRSIPPTSAAGPSTTEGSGPRSPIRSSRPMTQARPSPSSTLG